MIYCPVCKEEIDNDSRYCDQCGQALFYCSNCGRVGVGRRCTSCGSMMKLPGNQAVPQSISPLFQSPMEMSSHVFKSVTASRRPGVDEIRPESSQPPVLQLINESLNIHITAINGAVIGRRQGPYRQYFEQNMFVSGVHAQLFYNTESGWCVIDKHSSNGTQINKRPIQPDVQMTLRNDDVLTIANVSLQVKIV